MAKLVLEKPTPWLEKTKSTTAKSTNPMNDKVSFQGQSKNYGKKSNNTKASIPSKPHTLKSTTNKSKICLTSSRECFIAAGTPPTGFSFKTSLLSIVATLMIWFLFCWKEWKTEEVDLMKWTKTPVEAIPSLLFTLSVKSRLTETNLLKNTAR